MAKQAIGFKYFVPKLSYIDDEQRYNWDMTDFLDYTLTHRRQIRLAVPLGDEIADFEWTDAAYDDQNQLYRFRLSKLRSKNIPSKKRVNTPKDDIILENDEFLGEFNLLIFVPATGVLIMQSNFYGLTTKQMALALSGMRNEWKKATDDAEEPMGLVSLDPIPDQRAIQRARNATIYKSFKLRCSNIRTFADQTLNSDILNTAVHETDALQGNNIEISVTMGQGSRESTLSNNDVRLVMDDIEYLRRQNFDVSMHVATKQDEEHKVEVIDLVSPVYRTSLILEFADRTTIGAEYLYQNYLDLNYFDEDVHVQNTLNGLLPMN
ncbi:DUF6731 family protein [Lactiplantibacillus plantarum]|uniref:DUF6731 family protein n=1 Tax=Lactiplantibacillus plantarum TaxID=1590 RepID=UPI0006C91005|nr:DUF6731 family protein [Lactiplantibacillus plantarum]MBT9655997.1 hypothetical protein [Lactiplantibacillus plantarum]QXD12900.1 hypothetical protein N876_05250 [Lactiplantibacillus plantarum 2025]